MVNLGETGRILLAEDDDDDVFLFEQAMLEINLKFDLILAKNGMQVIDILTESQDFDIVFLDINMPLKNGLQCLLEIPSIPNFNQIPVICLSTSNDKTIISKVKELGGSGYITKPISYNKYINVLKDVLMLNKKHSLKNDFFLFGGV